jgi:hypothetical protein
LRSCLGPLHEIRMRGPFPNVHHTLVSIYGAGLYQGIDRYLGPIDSPSRAWCIRHSCDRNRQCA